MTENWPLLAHLIISIFALILVNENSLHIFTNISTFLFLFPIYFYKLIFEYSDNYMNLPLPRWCYCQKCRVVQLHCGKLIVLFC